MTDDTVNVDITDDLAAFSAEFFQTNEKPAAEPEKEEVEEADPEDKAEDEEIADDLGEEDDPPAPEDDDDEEEEEEEAPAPKKKRQSYQERINELTAKSREAERVAAALRKEYEEFKASVKESKPEETPLREMLSADAPSPDKLDKDGEPIYPLGEFDPLYIRDLTRFTIEQETKRAKEEAKVAAEKERDTAIRQQITEQWIDKVDTVEKELPDLREKMEDLTRTFDDIEPAYGEYLASTIMISELGPQIMYYLSENIGEAQKIVASGPAAATLAIGRLEAKLAKPSTTQEEPKRNKRVSEAPTPPENRTRGHGGKFAVAGDTDDLAAFEREFFKTS